MKHDRDTGALAHGIAHPDGRPDGDALRDILHSVTEHNGRLFTQRIAVALGDLPPSPWTDRNGHRLPDLGADAYATCLRLQRRRALLRRLRSGFPRSALVGAGALRLAAGRSRDGATAPTTVRLPL